jgi:hypothetical protein
MSNKVISHKSQLQSLKQQGLCTQLLQIGREGVGRIYLPEDRIQSQAHDTNKCSGFIKGGKFAS